MNPIALEILAAFGIRLLILPGHLTHIIQLFDVGLGGPLTRAYTDYFHSYIKNKEFIVPGKLPHH